MLAHDPAQAPDVAPSREAARRVQRQRQMGRARGRQFALQRPARRSHQGAPAGGAQGTRARSSAHRPRLARVEIEYQLQHRRFGGIEA